MASSAVGNVAAAGGDSPGKAARNSASSSSSGSASALNARLRNELMSLMMNPNADATAFPEEDNWLRWVGTIRGSSGTVYEGMLFRLLISFPSDYPFSAPTISFTTPIFHPNVDAASGAICLDILKDKWSATYSVSTILLSLQSLLGDPNNADPLNPQAAAMWANAEQFRRELRVRCKEAIEEGGAAKGSSSS